MKKYHKDARMKHQNHQNKEDKIVLDFSLLPHEFESRSILIGLPQDLKTRLVSLHQTLERVESALMFAGQSAKQTESWRAAAYLRASLSEYWSVGEVQKIDKPDVPPFKIINTHNPLLHLLGLLRHLNIHVKTSETCPHNISIIFHENEFQLNVFVLTNLDAIELSKLRYGEKYYLYDLEKTVDWFNSKQYQWGAGDLISLGTRLLAEQICLHHELYF